MNNVADQSDKVEASRLAQIGPAFSSMRQRQVEYVPPEPAVFKQVAHGIFGQVEAKGSVNQRSEIASGLEAFLSFAAQTMAKYLNTGYEEYLLKGYRKPDKTKEGV